MKNLALIFIAALMISLSSCQAIGDIFKAGVGVGIFAVVAVVAIIVFIIAKVAGGGSK